MNNLSALLWLGMCLPVALSARATGLPEEDIPASGWQAVSDERLDALRGGFDGGDGLKISLGIQRAVYIDGKLITSASVSIPDLAHVSASQAAALRAAAGSMNLVQNGPGNSIAPDALSSAPVATVVQNSLDNQQIRSLTIVDAATGSLGLLKSMNFQASLRDVLGAPAPGR